MSRTYRIRHLPRLNALKYTDCGTGRFEDSRDEEFEKLFYSAYPEARRPNGRIRWSYWSMKWQLQKRYDQENPVPVGRASCHPWVRWTRISTCKVWYKKFGNKTVRRHNRQVIRNFGHLGDEVDNRKRFYSRKDGWDIWVLW